MSQDSISVESYVQRLRDGDESALAELFEHYRFRLEKIIDIRLDPRIRGRVEPADILQEAFINMAKKLPDYESRSEMSIYVWMRLVVCDRIHDAHRRHLYADKRNIRREISISQRANDDATSYSFACVLLGTQTSASGRLARAERHEVLAEKLDELSPYDREIILLRSFEQLSNDEAAEILGITKYSASKRYIRALKRLQKLLLSLPGFESLMRPMNPHE